MDVMETNLQQLCEKKWRVCISMYRKVCCLNLKSANSLQLFKFTAPSSAVMVAPGLSVSGLLEFIPEKEEEVRDRLLIHVDNTEIIEVPLLG